MRRHVNIGARGQRGFSMFELVVYILVASILFSVALNRYRDLPDEAERANFTAILAQLNAALNLQMMHRIASGSWQDAEALEGLNPMDLMLTTPGNYVGAFAGNDQNSLPRRTWYFDTAQQQLVYLANDADELTLLVDGRRTPTDSVRFRVTNSYNTSAGSGRGRWQGVILAPVVPFEWQANARALPATAPP